MTIVRHIVHETNVGILMLKCNRCKKKIRGEPTYVGSSKTAYCKSCAEKVAK